MYVRPTTMAAAFVNAALKHKEEIEKVDHNRWVARRVAANTERKGFALVNEFDHSPRKQPKESQ